MIKYNVTVRVEPSVVDEWIVWMKEEHIPQVMETGIFTQYEFSELIDPIDPDVDAKTYTIQYWCPTVEQLNLYFSDFAPALRGDSAQKFGERCLAFRTVMRNL